MAVPIVSGFPYLTAGAMIREAGCGDDGNKQHSQLNDITCLMLARREDAMGRALVAFVITIGIGILASITGSAPTFAQNTCQQNCQAQYPGNLSDTFQIRARNKCINACNRAGVKK